MQTQYPISRRAFLRGMATVAGGSVLLAACAVPAAPVATEGATASSAPSAGKEEITLEAWTDLTGDPEMWAQVWAELKEATGVTMNVTTTPFSDVETKVLTSVAGGQPPNLTMGHPMMTSTFGYKKLLVDFNPYIEKEQYDLSGFFPGAVKALSYGGKTYGLPWSYNFLLYYYNKHVIEAAGLEDPYEVWKAGNWNLDTFIKYGDEIAQGEGDSQVFSITEPPHTARVQLSFLRGFGGEIWSEDLKQVVINSPESLQGWDFLADHIRKDWSPAAAGRDQNYQTTMTPLFNNGRIALYLNIRSFSSTFDLNLIDPGMVPYPVWPVGKSITRSVGEGMVALEGTEHVDAIWECNKFWSTRGHQILLENLGSNPSGPAGLDSDVWVKALQPWEKNDVYKFAAETGIPDNLPPGFNEQDKICQAFYDEIALGKRSAQEAMTDAQMKMQEVLDEYA